MDEILVVDDDRQVLQMIKHILQISGMQVQCATSGDEALHLLGQAEYCLMITDLNMPGMDGFALARKVSAIAPHIGLILCTADISPDVTLEAEAAGIQAVLAKPFTPGQILETIRKIAMKRGG